MESLKSFLQDISGKKINFLVGSAASLPFLSTLNLGNNLPSFEEIVVSDLIDENNKIKLYAYFFEEIVKKSLLLETEGDAFYNTTLKSYEDLIEIFFNILNTEGNESPKRINIFTTNYDIFFEKSFDNFNKKNNICYFNDGSGGFINRYVNISNFHLNVTHSGINDFYKREIPTINLFKMHGSSSWIKENNLIKVEFENKNITELYKMIYPKPATTTEENYNEEIKNFVLTKVSEITETLQRLDGEVKDLTNESDIFNSINDGLSSINIDQSYLDGFDNTYKEIPIINPNKWKFHDTIFNQHYYQMIRSFSYELERKNSVLIVFGFSFADEHIRELFLRSLLNPTLKVYIICYNKDSKEKMKALLGNSTNITYLPNKWTHNGTPLAGDIEYLKLLLRGNINE